MNQQRVLVEKTVLRRFHAQGAKQYRIVLEMHAVVSGADLSSVQHYVCEVRYEYDSRTERRATASATTHAQAERVFDAQLAAEKVHGGTTVLSVEGYRMEAVNDRRLVDLARRQHAQEERLAAQRRDAIRQQDALLHGAKREVFSRAMRVALA